MNTPKEQENKCICACHDTEWNSYKKHNPVEHDTKCCDKMNGSLTPQHLSTENTLREEFINKFGNQIDMYNDGSPIYPASLYDIIDWWLRKMKESSTAQLQEIAEKLEKERVKIKCRAQLGYCDGESCCASGDFESGWEMEGFNKGLDVALRIMREAGK